MDNRRLIILLIFSFSVVMLWDAWQKQTAALHSATIASISAQTTVPTTPGAVPAVTQSASPALGQTSVPVVATSQVYAGPITTVRTDLFLAQIAAQGGDLIKLELLGHPDSHDKSRPFVLFDAGERHVYLGQSGVIGSDYPNHRTVWSGAGGERTLASGDSEIKVQLTATGANGVVVAKTYTFTRGSYQVRLEQSGIAQGTHVYHQITRDGNPAEGKDTSMAMGVSTFTGPAVFTEKAKFQKVDFADIEKGGAKYASKSNDGWLAMIQHYFVSAWLPLADVEREFYMRKAGDNLYSVGVITPVGEDGKSAMTLYAGPQEQDKLEAIAPGLQLVVDYGWLTVIAAPLFWVLELIHKLTGNWGWAIIGLTVLLKAIFFPLSAASYKSMAKMRVLTPKLAKLKETFGDDKQRLNQEMMELYKREKVNPLGGGLPVLVQIPVFIALYWVLLGTVEMRNAPWLGWIVDLSVKDPYFVLPIIMGVTQLVMTKLNPTPPDPIQAKVMMMMPIVFTVMFLFFPAGLVLYWTVNNLLSMAQQWQITRAVEGGQLS
jgi:YidC/Oxa1 family membrane protein insertase